jgi:hypothetical protein
MPDINNQVALGVRPTAPQSLTDVVAPITSLAQIQYLGANADRLKAETSGLEQSAAFARGKNQALQSFNDLRSKDVPAAEALDRSGLAGWDPSGANAILGNVTTSRNLQANEAYAKANPSEPLAIAGPEVVGKDVTNKSTAATTAKTNVEVTQQHMQLYGQIGNIMTAPGGTTPQGRAVAADTARRAGFPEAEIQKFLALPDDQYKVAGQHLQVASMSPEKYMDVSGQAKYNQGVAAAATANEKLSPGEVPNRGPAAYAVTHGEPIPPLPGTSLGGFGSPPVPSSLGQPNAALPSKGAPSPTSPAFASGSNLTLGVPV